MARKSKTVTVDAVVATVTEQTPATAIVVQTPGAVAAVAEHEQTVEQKAKHMAESDAKAAKALDGAVSALVKAETGTLAGKVLCGTLCHEHCRWYMDADPSRQRSNAVQGLVAALARHASEPVNPAYVETLMRVSAAYTLLDGKTHGNNMPYGAYEKAYVQLVERVNGNTASETFALLPGWEQKCNDHFRAKATVCNTVTEHVAAVRTFMATYHDAVAELKAATEAKAKAEADAKAAAEKAAADAAFKAKCEAEASAKAVKDAKDADKRARLTAKAEADAAAHKAAAAAEKAAHNAAIIADKDAARAAEDTSKAATKADNARMAAEGKKPPRKDAPAGSLMTPDARKTADPKDVADMLHTFLTENANPVACLQMLLRKCQQDAKHFNPQTARALNAALVIMSTVPSKDATAAVA